MRLETEDLPDLGLREAFRRGGELGARMASLDWSGLLRRVRARRPPLGLHAGGRLRPRRRGRVGDRAHPAHRALGVLEHAGAGESSVELGPGDLLAASQRFAPGAPIDDTALLVLRVTGGPG
jgi:hypothetical protein